MAKTCVITFHEDVNDEVFLLWAQAIHSMLLVGAPAGASVDIFDTEKSNKELAKEMNRLNTELGSWVVEDTPE